jgi:hypothetical protein
VKAQTYKISKISLAKIARIYKKNPKAIGVIWVRKVVTNKMTFKLPPEYKDFKDLFKEKEEKRLLKH